jgi:aminoglycoside phosphotransferase (APT) family kinase protein
VPAVVEVRRSDGADAPGLLLTRWLPATPGDRALPVLDEAGRARMGAAMGRVAATLAGMPTQRGGSFVDADLVPQPFLGDLTDWVDRHEAGLRGWDEAALASLLDVADHAEELLEQAGRACLVHSDLNPKNVLVDTGEEVGGEVVAVLDWEFAHSGHPFTDLGNVLRFDRDPAYAEAALAAYVDLRGGRRQETLDTARAADLWALVELAARPVRNRVTDRAERLLRTVATTRDLHAWPDGW